jgi:hypothetical protein
MQDTSVQPANAENQNNQNFLNVKNYHKNDRRLHRGGKAAFKAGDVIPYRLPVKPGGSRFYVKAESRHADGRWTVMLHRKFNTGQEEDVVFDPASDSASPSPFLTIPAATTPRPPAAWCLFSSAERPET